MTRSTIVLGQHQALRSGQIIPVPAYVPSGLEEILDWVTTDSSERCVIVSSSLRVHLGLPDKLTSAKPADMTAPGWRNGLPDVWTTYEQGGRRVHLCIDDWAGGTRHPITEGPPTVTARRLDDWYDLTGCCYRGIPGIAGTALLRQLAGQRRPSPLWHHDSPPSAYEPELRWTRPGPTQPPTPPIGETVLDANRAYLAAALTAEVAAGALHHFHHNEAPVVVPGIGQAGWWRLAVTPPWHHETLMPAPIRPGQRNVWVTTPTIKLMAQLAQQGCYAFPEITESMTAPGRRIFRTWAETLDHAIKTVRWVDNTPDQPLTTTLKQAYRETIGLLNREGGAIHRPDWSATIIAQARATLWRKAWTHGNTTGQWPTNIDVDALTYTTTPNLPIGPALGQFKVKAVAR